MQEVIMKLPKLTTMIFALMLIPLSSALAVPQSVLDGKAKKAIRTSNVAMLTQWIENGGEINQTTQNGNTLLILASKIGDRPTIEFLLSKHPNIDQQNKVGATALMLAAKYGHDHVVKMLLERGADATVTNKSGLSAAQFALAYEHQQLYQKLQDAMLKRYRNNEQAGPNS